MSKMTYCCPMCGELTTRDRSRVYCKDDKICGWSMPIPQREPNPSCSACGDELTPTVCAGNGYPAVYECLNPACQTCGKPRNVDTVTPKPLFESNATATLDRVKATFCQRGSEYGDTWRNAQWLAMKATGKTFGITLTDDQWRALAAGCLVDVKYWRLMGGYKEDTGIDGIAYEANWVEMMRQYENKS